MVPNNSWRKQMHDFSFPVLDTPAKCAALWPRYPQKVVGMWATASRRQNVDVLWRLRQELLRLGIRVVFFFQESAKPMLRAVLAEEALTEREVPPDIYQLEDVKFYRLLNFVEVLITNDYILKNPDEMNSISAKLVSLPHSYRMMNPYYWNRCFDYCVSEISEFADFDYSIFPNAHKIHRNREFTLLPAGYPKIDLLLEQRQKCLAPGSPPVLLCYPTLIWMTLQLQELSHAGYAEIWARVIEDFLSFRPGGLAVFRPMGYERAHEAVKLLAARFSADGRFILDTDDDNKFWLARAAYFVTDYSTASRNFCLTARKPAIRMVCAREETLPQRDEWGWCVSRPGQVLPLLEEMDWDAARWNEHFAEKIRRELPTLGRAFPLLAGMVRRILENDDDPAWPRLPKGDTPCETPADLLKLTARFARKSRHSLSVVTHWMARPDISPSNPRIWLQLLKRALTVKKEIDQGEFWELETPRFLSVAVDNWLSGALNSLPMEQVLGLLRYCLRKNPDHAVLALFSVVLGCHMTGYHKKRALFFLLMEVSELGPALEQGHQWVKTMPQYFSRPVLEKLTRLLPAVTRLPLPLRRLLAGAVGMQKPLARRYWRAHRALAQKKPSQQGRPGSPKAEAGLVGGATGAPTGARPAHRP